MIVLPWPDKRLSPNARWSHEEDEALRVAWEAGFSRKEICAASGRSVGAIANRASRLRVSSPRKWTENELQVLREAYTTSATSEELNVKELAARLGRSYNSVAVKAGRLGLTDAKRKGVIRRKDCPKFATLEELRAAQSEGQKARLKANGHPRGFSGKTHSQAARAAISKKAQAWSASLSLDEKSALSLKILKAKAERGGVNSARSRGAWKAGWREIGEKRNYYRSRWEANYARYLEWLKSRGEIKDWQHEPETFWFDAIKRGVRSYLPDFRVWENEGTSRLHEVKGWMDARSKTTLKRMAKYHPQETIILIRERDYNAIARKVGGMIEGWETSSRSDRL